MNDILYLIIFYIYNRENIFKERVEIVGGNVLRAEEKIRIYQQHMIDYSPQDIIIRNVKIIHHVKEE